MVLEPIFERAFAAQDYGFRPGRRCKDALRRGDELLEAGHVHVVDADLESYFDMIPKDRLLAGVGRRVINERVLGVVRAFLDQNVLDGNQVRGPEQGTPYGASNIYLAPLDHLMAEPGYEMVGYADDFAVLCGSPEDAARDLGAGAGLDGAGQSTQHRSRHGWWTYGWI